MRLWTFYVSLATHDDLKNGIVASEWRKIIVGDPVYWSAYKTTVAMAWRTEKQVTGIYFIEVDCANIDYGPNCYCYSRLSILSRHPDRG